MGWYKKSDKYDEDIIATKTYHTDTEGKFQLEWRIKTGNILTFDRIKEIMEAAWYIVSDDIHKLSQHDGDVRLLDSGMHVLHGVPNFVINASASMDDEGEADQNIIRSVLVSRGFKR